MNRPLLALGLFALLTADVLAADPAAPPARAAASNPKTPKPWIMPPAPEGVVIEKDVAYITAESAEKADLYLPANRAADVRSPAVLMIHGGGWEGGDKCAPREFNIGTNLALNGYVGLSINYVLATPERTTWPRNLQECKTAVRWLRKNAERLQIDAEHIGVIGGSAGGHLAAMVALTGPADGFDPPAPDEAISCRVQCGVDLYGPSDLLLYRPSVTMLGKTRDEAPELYGAASSVTYVDHDDPPMLILHGTADKTVLVEQSELLAEALRKAGVEHELVIVEGARHSFHFEPPQRDLRPLVLGFFAKHLKPTK